MKKIICLLLAFCMIIALAACGKQAEPETVETTVPEQRPFAYIHDPRDNPEAMKDIVENPDAVYGFSPDPESKRLGTFADYDWTDPAVVANAQAERRAYHESMDSMTDILYRMKEKGASIEKMARAVSEERNRLRLEAYDGNPEGLADAKKSNLETYGHEEGPTPDQLFEKYGSWTTVLQKAFSSNMGMDACCGLYDEYYRLYIELGYVEESSEDSTIEKPNQSAAEGMEQKEETSERPAAADGLSQEGYKLEQVLVLSRHNIRAPLSRNGSVLDVITPHSWFEWSAGPGELSLRGGVLETEMGQYFRKWLEAEGLFPENYFPEEGAVRIYANSRQRTIATAQYFVSGLMPAANIPVETHAEFDEMDPVFNPKLGFVSQDYIVAAEKQIWEMYTEAVNGLADNYGLLADVIDLDQSEAWANGTQQALRTDDTELIFELNEEPRMTGSLQVACSGSDALILQYYEEADLEKAAFGHALSLEQWKQIAEIKDVYGDVLFTAPLIAANAAHPLLQEIHSELETEGRTFTFLCGHDANIGAVLAALGAEKYELPGAIEGRTPIGGKLVFCRWREQDNTEYCTVSLVYQTAEQLRGMPLLGLERPPAVVPLCFSGLELRENGMYDMQEFMQRLEDAMAEYDCIVEEYALADAA